MKKTLLAAVAAFGLLASASAQSTDNCTNIKAILKDLPNDLKNYKGREVMEGAAWDPKVTLSGYETVLVHADDFSIDYRAITTAYSSKAEAKKAAEALAAQLKTCLPDYKMENMTTADFIEIDFNNKTNDKIQAVVTVQETSETSFQVALFLRKNKDL